MCSGNKFVADPYALMLNKGVLFLTNASKGVQENSSGKSLSFLSVIKLQLYYHPYWYILSY